MKKSFANWCGAVPITGISGISAGLKGRQFGEGLKRIKNLRGSQLLAVSAVSFSRDSRKVPFQYQVPF